MKRIVIPLLATFAFLGALGFWGSTIQSILWALVVLGVVALTVEVLGGK